MNTQHLSLTIDSLITIADTLPKDNGISLADTIYHTRQVRLLAAVKNHSQMLTCWMHQMILDEMHVHVWYDWDNMLMGGEIGLRDILAPAIATLTNNAQDFSEKVDKVNYFEDVINLFQPSSRDLEEPALIREQGEAK